MRYITIPEPEVLEGVTLPGEDGTPTPVSYALHSLNREFIWTDPAWLATGDACEAHARCREAFAAAPEPGNVVALSDADYDLYRPIALRAGESIPVTNPSRPALLAARVGLLKPVLMAAAKDPREAPADAE